MELKRGQLIQFVSDGPKGEYVHWQAIFHGMETFDGMPVMRVHTALKGRRGNTWLAQFWPKAMTRARFGWKMHR
jgi:hypothetical protein